MQIDFSQINNPEDIEKYANRLTAGMDIYLDRVDDFLLQSILYLIVEHGKRFNLSQDNDAVVHLLEDMYFNTKELKNIFDLISLEMDFKISKGTQKVDPALTYWRYLHNCSTRSMRKNAAADLLAKLSE